MCVTKRTLILRDCPAGASRLRANTEEPHSGQNFGAHRLAIVMTSIGATHQVSRAPHGKFVRMQRLFGARPDDEAFFGNGKDP